MKKVILLAGFLLIFAAQAFAGTATTTFSVNANVPDVCSALTTTNMNFGGYDGSADLTTTGTVSVTCINGTAYTIALSEGWGMDGSSRYMYDASWSSFLAYDLYTDSGHTTVWGDDYYGSSVSDTGTGAQQDFTMYGLLPGGQSSLTAGHYSDTITVTVTY